MKITDVPLQAFLVLELLGFRAKSPAELEAQLYRMGYDVVVPGVQGRDKLLHREADEYGTSMSPSDRCWTTLPDRVRRGQVPEDHYKAEYDTDEKMDEQLEQVLEDGQIKVRAKKTGAEPVG